MLKRRSMRRRRVKGAAEHPLASHDDALTPPAYAGSMITFVLTGVRE